MRLFKSKEKLSESESAYLADIEQKIKAYKAKGYRVPTRKMIKTAAQIKGIRRSAAINTAVLDSVAAHIHEGMNDGRNRYISLQFYDRSRSYSCSLEL